MKWFNNTDLYITHFIEGSHSKGGAGDGLGGTPGHNELYLLHNIALSADTQRNNPTQIIIPTISGASGDECQDFDVSPDNTHLLYSDCSIQITPIRPKVTSFPMLVRVQLPANRWQEALPAGCIKIQLVVFTMPGISAIRQ